MENLQDLSNDQLRVRLQQYGFANLPITETTRGVLIKKLHRAIEGEQSKNRRETVAVSKFSSDEDIETVKQPSRRATVAVAEKTRKTISSNGPRPETPKALSPKAPARRTSRATPAKEKQPVVITHEVSQEDTDEDIVETRTRRSRTTTPTLGKSDVVRTTYKSTVAAVHEDDVVYLDDDEEDVSPPPRKSTPVLPSTTLRKTFATATTVLTPKRYDSHTPSKYGRTTISTSFNPSSNYTSVPQEDDDDDYLDDADTPYLSEFVKKLNESRAEPLDVAGMNKIKRKTMDVPLSASYKPRYGYESGAAPQPRSGVIRSVGKTYDSLDRQFNIRTISLIATIVMIVVAIYVFFA